MSYYINGDETASDNVRLSELENEIESLQVQLNKDAYGGCAYCCKQPISLFAIELFDWSKIHPEYFGSGDELVKRM